MTEPAPSSNSLPIKAPAGVSPERLAEIRSMEDGDLRALIEGSFLRAARELYDASAALAELEERGLDVNPYRRGIYSFLFKVAEGRLAPEALLAFAGRQSVLRSLAAGSSLKEQVEIAAGKTLPVVVIDPATGEKSHKVYSADVILRTKGLPELVFGPDGVRNVTEQEAMLNRTPRPTTPLRFTVGKVTADRSNMTMKVGREVFPVADAIAALRTLGLI